MTVTALGILVVALALITATVAIIVTWRATGRRVTMTTGSIVIAIGIGFVLAAGLLPAFVIKSPNVSFTSPRGGQFVPIKVTANGTVQNLGQDQELWIVVEPQENSRFYPQTGPVVVTSSRWTSGDIFVGNTKDIGKRFDILAVLADSKAQAEFLAYLSESQRTQSFPGFGDLPPGAAVAARVVVTRS